MARPHTITISPEGRRQRYSNASYYHRQGQIAQVSRIRGTTGAPKGVKLTHGNITWNVINFLSVVDFRSDDVTIASRPP
jgi:long-subunit acyl-CoA synthetase (AMP-forming)